MWARSTPRLPFVDPTWSTAPASSANHTTATFCPLAPTSGSAANPSAEPSACALEVPTVCFVQVAPAFALTARRISPVAAFVQTA